MGTRRTAARTMMAAVAVAALMAGCTTAAPSPSAPPATSTASPSSSPALLPLIPPATFAKTATWETVRAKGAPVLVTRMGVLTLTPGDDDGTYRPVLLSATTGQPQWSGRPVEGRDAIPSLHWVQEGDRYWAVMTVTDKDAKAVKMYVYDGLANDTNRPAIRSASFEGVEKSPTVVVSDSGVLVSGSTVAAHLRYRPESGNVTKFGEAPTRTATVDGKDIEVGGVPTLAYGGGWLLTYPKAGFAYATTQGGWESTSVAPPGAESGGEEIVTRPRQGFMVALWPGERAATQVLAVHRVTDGEVVAHMVLDSNDQDKLTDQMEASFALVTDQEWLVWGGFVFDLRAGSGEIIDFGGGRATTIIDGLVYIRNADHVPGDGETPEPSPSPTEDASTRDDSAGRGQFSGFMMVDAGTAVVAPGRLEMVPIGVSGYGQGIFVDGDTIYSVPLA